MKRTQLSLDSSIPEIYLSSLLRSPFCSNCLWLSLESTESQRSALLCRGKTSVLEGTGLPYCMCPRWPCEGRATSSQGAPAPEGDRLCGRLRRLSFLGLPACPLHGRAAGAHRAPGSLGFSRSLQPGLPDSGTNQQTLSVDLP